MIIFGEVVERILDIGRIAMAAEMLGNAESAFESTIEYLKQRKQFGVLIGTFQALQHRAAEMFCEIELTKSAVMAAIHGADDNSKYIQGVCNKNNTLLILIDLDRLLTEDEWTEIQNL